MSSVAQPPAAVRPLIKQYLAQLLLWFSSYVYARLLTGEANHRLVRLAGLVALEPLEQACAGFHQPDGGRGRPVRHSVKRLVRALLVKYLDDLSLRELEERIRLDMAVKWFVGYGLHEVGPDHSTLERFEQYVRTKAPRLFFDTVLRQIDAAFPGQRQQRQIGDTFALLADAALE